MIEESVIQKILESYKEIYLTEMFIYGDVSKQGNTRYQLKSKHEENILIAVKDKIFILGPNLEGIEEFERFYPNVIERNENMDASYLDIDEIDKCLANNLNEFYIIGIIKENSVDLEITNELNLRSSESNLLKKILNSTDINMIKFNGRVILSKRTNRRNDSFNYFYHGTCLKFLPSILKEGIISKKSLFGIDTKNIVFVSTVKESAINHAAFSARHYDSLPVLLEVVIYDEDLLVPDYDVDKKSNEIGLSKNNYYKTGIVDNKSIGKFKETGLFGYKGNIYPNRIKWITIFSQKGKELLNKSAKEIFENIKSGISIEDMINKLSINVK